MTHRFLLHGSLRPTSLEKNLKPCAIPLFDNFRETIAFLASIFLLLIMAYCKDTSSFYHLNSAVRNDLLKLGTPNFTAIKTREEWFDWTRGPFLETLHSHYILGGLNSEKVCRFRLSYLSLTFCMLGNFSCCCHLLTFFKINFFNQKKNKIRKTYQECKTVRIKIRIDILSVLIWFRAVERLSTDDKSHHPQG